MAVGSFVSYLRVSTQSQGADGLGVDGQRADVTRYLNGGAWTLLAEYVEVESGKRTDRLELARALAHARRHRATLVIAKLDRLARDVHFISGLAKAGVPFVACDMPNASEFETNIRASMAQEEGRLISVRTRAALQAARARGTKLGGHRGDVAAARSRTVKAERADAAAEAVRGAVARARQAGVTSLAGIARYLDEIGVHTRSGGTWHASQVRALLARLDRPA